VTHLSPGKKLLISGWSALVVGLAGGCSMLPPEVDGLGTADCVDPALSHTSADTTLMFHGSGTEMPAIVSESSVSVPLDWKDADKLLMPAGTVAEDAAIACLLGPSDEQHDAAPDVRVDQKSQPARAVVHERVSVNNGYGTASWSLGQWQLGYRDGRASEQLSVTGPDGKAASRTVEIEPGAWRLLFS
jgi:hypothetical protein